MHHLKPFTALAFLTLPFVPSGCGTKFDDCSSTRTCPHAPRAGNAGASGSSAGTTAGGPVEMTGGRAGNLGASGEGGEDTSGGTPGEAAAGGGAGGSELGGSGGSGTSLGAGEGGEAGAEQPPECESDAACDDGLFCNGVERCEGGQCQPSPSPFICANPDEEHCSVLCREGGEEARCVVEALDEDEDGHRSARCAAAPGDDCNDENALTHPGAPEACDGLDNDCDSRTDFDDGLELGGQTSSFSGVRELALAWMPGPGPGATPEDAQFRMVTATPVVGLATIVLDEAGGIGHGSTPLALGNYAFSAPRLAGGTDRFGLSYTKLGRGGYSVDGTQIDRSGAPSETSIFRYADGGDIARRANIDWLVATRDIGTVAITRYSDAGMFEDGPTLASDDATTVSWVRIATQGGESAVVWQVEPNLLRWASVSSDLIATAPASLGATGYRPDIAAVETGYAVAWAVSSGIGFKRLTTDGRTLCDTSLIPLGLDEASESHRVALADSAHGTLALVTSAAGKVVLVRVDEDCAASDVVPVADTPDAGSPAIAVGSGSVALAWVDQGQDIAYSRLVGERLCE